MKRAFGWLWWWVESEGRTSVAFPEAHVDPGRSIESTCLVLELDLPDEDKGRVRSPLSRRLGEWRPLIDSWRLSDPRRWSLWPRSSLCDLWRSDPLVLKSRRTVRINLPQTHWMRQSCWTFCHGIWKALDVLDKESVFVFFAESCCCQVDLSSLFLTGGACRLSSGAWSSIESSMVSWALLAAATALRFCFCFNALSNAAHASGSQSLQTSHGDSSVHSVKPSFKRHCWHLWSLSLWRLKWEQPWAAPETKTCHVIPPCCFVYSKRATFHASRNKVEFMANETSKNVHSCDRLASEVSSHQLTSYLASKNAWEDHWDSACRFTSAHGRGENRSPRLADAVLCAGAAVHGGWSETQFRCCEISPGIGWWAESMQPLLRRS